MKRKYLFVAISLLLILGSCRKEPDKEYFLDIPEPDLSALQIELNADNIGDTIRAPYPYLKYTLAMPEGFSARISTEREKLGYIPYALPSSYIKVPMDQGVFTLYAAIFQTSEDGGSVAGNSNYAETIMEWTILPNPQPMTLNVDLQLNNKNEYEVFWESPSDYYGEVDHYRITNDYHGSVETQDTFCAYPTMRFPADEDFKVTAFFKNELVNTWTGEAIFNLKTSIYVEETTAVDKISVSWDRVYNALYDVYIDEKLKVSNLSDTTAIIESSLAFCRSCDVKVVAKLGKYEGSSSLKYTRGKEVKYQKDALYAYNLAENLLYLLNLSEVYCLELPDLNRIIESVPIQYSLESIYYEANNDEVLVVTASGNCWVLSAKNLELQRIIKFDYDYYGGIYFCHLFVEENELTVFRQYYDGVFCEKYNYQSGEFIGSEKITADFSMNSDFYFSGNGKYLVTYDKINKIFRYFVENAETEKHEEVLSENTEYTRFCFNTNNEEELFAQKGSTIEVLNVKDLSVKRKIELNATGKTRNMDVKTGNFLYLTENNTAIIFSNDGRKLFEIGFHEDNSFYKAALMGDVLMYQGYALDVSKYL